MSKKHHKKYTDRYKRIMINIKKKLPHACYYCGKQLSHCDLTVDHLIPLSRGGKTEYSNLRICCRRCNNEKGNMTEQEYYAYIYNTKEKHYNIDTYVSIENIVIPDLFLKHSVMKKKINKVNAYYKYFHCLDEPITIKKQNNLLTNGYVRYVYAKENNIDKIPVIYDNAKS